MPILAYRRSACENNFLMQFQSDILNTKVIRPGVLESTALGCAYLAGLFIGFYSLEKLSKSDQAERVFIPQMDEESRKKLLSQWHEAVKRIKT